MRVARVGGGCGWGLSGAMGTAGRGCGARGIGLLRSWLVEGVKVKLIAGLLAGAALLLHTGPLLAHVEAGEEVVIARRGRPVARLVRCQPRGKRQFGAMKGRIRITDAFFEPLPAEELKLWEGR